MKDKSVEVKTGMDFIGWLIITLLVLGAFGKGACTDCYSTPPLKISDCK